MKPLAIRGLALLGLFVLIGTSVRAQGTLPDTVFVRDLKTGAEQKLEGTFKVSPKGFQVFKGDKGSEAFNPDDIVKFDVGDLEGLPRDQVRDALTKEGNKEYEAARTAYTELIKKAGKEQRSKRYLTYKKTQMTNRMVDELDADKGWKEKAEACVGEWGFFLIADDLGIKTGWEQWFAVRASTRLQIELGKYDDAARVWQHVSKNPNMPAEYKLEASLQEVDLLIRGEQYAVARTNATELLKTATGARKERLNIYAIAAKAGSDGKPLEGVDKIKAEMDKSKDASVHATGFSMMGELCLAGKKPRDAMWNFLWIETVTNQDKDEVLKALVRLVKVFEAQNDDDQMKKYQEKLKRIRGSF